MSNFTKAMTIAQSHLKSTSAAQGLVRELQLANLIVPDLEDDFAIVDENELAKLSDVVHDMIVDSLRNYFARNASKSVMIEEEAYQKGLREGRAEAFREVVDAIAEVRRKNLSSDE